MKGGMRFYILIFFLTISAVVFSQAETTDTIHFKLLFQKDEPLIGANIYVKDARLEYGAISDVNGEAELVFKGKEPIIELSFLGSYVSLKLTTPIDSVFLNLATKKSIYYYKKKKVKKVRVNIDCSINLV